MILDTILLTYNLKLTLDELAIIDTNESRQFINACAENNISLNDCLEMINDSSDILTYNYIPAYLTDGEACAIRAYIDLKNALANDDIELHLGEGGPNQPTYLTLKITSSDSPKERLSKIQERFYDNETIRECKGFEAR